jgi:hypothetical protein
LTGLPPRGSPLAEAGGRALRVRPPLSGVPRGAGLEVVEALEGPLRADAPRAGTRENAQLDDRLRRVRGGVVEVVRRGLAEVSLADLAGGRTKGPTR